MTEKRRCQRCGKEYEPYRLSAKWCSQSCKQAFHSERVAEWRRQERRAYRQQQQARDAEHDAQAIAAFREVEQAS